MDAMEAVLRELTLADLRDWAGGNILARAQTYVRCVNELSCTPDGRLAAWVQGSGRYVTTVRLPERGEYEHACTCPYEFGGPCKHAVAVVPAVRSPPARRLHRSIPTVNWRNRCASISKTSTTRISGRPMAMATMMMANPEKSPTT